MTFNDGNMSIFKMKDEIEMKGEMQKRQERHVKC